MSTRTIRNLFAPGVALTLLLAASTLHAAAKKDPPKPTADECLACHSDATLSHEVNGKTVSLHVDPQAFKDSIHGSMFTCVDCHTDVKSSAHETPPQHITCATCHADEQAAYERSFHAKAVKRWERESSHLRGLSRQPARTPAGGRPQVARPSQQYSGDMRSVPQPEICDGGQRPSCPDGRLV